MANHAQWQNSRNVSERIYIQGDLVLLTPASFGNGDAEGTTDMPLLLDPLDGATPLLTGASIAGALRNALREWEKGCGTAEKCDAQIKLLSEQLFGHLDDAPDATGAAQKSTVESCLMVDDALGRFPEGQSLTELRDGVAIDPSTRTVEEDERGGHKFDLELLPAGTTFTLSFELWNTSGDDHLLAALSAALKGLEQGSIGLGMRKRRGLGQCRVTNWRVWRYPMNQASGFWGWLKHDGKTGGAAGQKIETLLGVSLPDDRREIFTITADFRLCASLLIRSEGQEGDLADMVHLSSYRPGGAQPVLTGTSLAGALRARTLRIAKTMLGAEAGSYLVDDLFGRRIRSAKDAPSGSQVTVRESAISGGESGLVQNRVKLDRFTGGSYPQALFTQQPLWEGKGAQVQIHLELRRMRHPEEDSADDKIAEKASKQAEADFRAKAGLLLLALKDLWTGDLPLGGESSVGRGRLTGQRADITLGGKVWCIQQNETGLTVDGAEDLQALVDAFLAWSSVQEVQS